MSFYASLRSTIPSIGIVYSCVARGNTVLVWHALCPGNYPEVIARLLSEIVSTENSTMTFASGEYMFHFTSEDGIIYICITDDDFERSRAFAFLEEIKFKFITAVGDKAQTLPPNSLNITFKEELETQMRMYSEDTSLVINGDPGQIRLENIRIENIDPLTDGSTEAESLLQLEESDEIIIRSLPTEAQERRERCRRWWKRNCKGVAIISIIIVVILMVILVLFGVIYVLDIDLNDL